MLSNGANIPKIIDDELEQSGDDEIGIISFTTQQTDFHISSNEDEITKAFANQHQKQQNQTIQQTKSDKMGRTQSKGKQPNPKKPDLNDDVNDFVDLIPKAEVKAKIEEYYRNDMDVQHIFEYMHGKEFLELRKSTLELSDVKDILQHLNKNGLNVKSILRKLDNRLGVSKIRSTQLAYNSQPKFGKLSKIQSFLFLFCLCSILQLNVDSHDIRNLKLFQVRIRQSVVSMHWLKMFLVYYHKMKYSFYFLRNWTVVRNLLLSFNASVIQPSIANIQRYGYNLFWHFN